MLSTSTPVISTHLQLSTPSPPVELVGQIGVMEERMNLDTDQLPTGLNKNSTKLYKISLLWCLWERSPIMFIGISVLEGEKNDKYGVIILPRF